MLIKEAVQALPDALAVLRARPNPSLSLRTDLALGGPSMPSAEKSARAIGDSAATERTAAPSPIEVGIQGSARLATQRQKIRKLFGNAAWSPDDASGDREASVDREDAPTQRAQRPRTAPLVPAAKTVAQQKAPITKAPALSSVAQRAGLKRLRIGITGTTTSLGILANQLPSDTYVWSPDLSERPVHRPTR
jgi:hypothetical protein